MTPSGTLTILSTFDDVASARQALDALAKEGFLPEKMHIEPAEPATDRSAGAAARSVTAAPKHGLARIERFFERLLGRADQPHHAGDDSRAVRGGRSVVIVETTSEVSAERAATVMKDLGAYDLTEESGAERDGSRSAADAGTERLGSDVEVRWRAAHVVYRASDQPLRGIAETE